MSSQFDPLITSSHSKICVIAAPGSGKTSQLLIPKAKALLDDPAVKPEEVLLLTFSRLSAQDLKRKVASLEHIPKAMTVHSCALAFLMSENNHTIRDRVDSIVLDFERDILLSDLKIVFPSRHKRNELKKDLKEFSAGWAITPHDQVFVENDYQQSFRAAVVNWLVEHKAALMEEIVYFAVDLARQLPDARLLNEPQYILVDEYQDLNELEQAFVDTLAAKSQLLIVVGDPDQSIYSFKFAHPQGINDFFDRHDVQTLSGLTTWRCPRKVVYFANQLLKQISPGRESLLEARAGAIDGDVEFFARETQDEEFALVLQSVAKQLASGIKPNDIIVLAPKKVLGADFVSFANEHKGAAGIANPTEFHLCLKPTFTAFEKERVLLLALVAKPDSLLHARAYLGLGDDKSHFSKQLRGLKDTWGSLQRVLDGATSADVPIQKKRLKQLTQRVEALRGFMKAHENSDDLDEVLNELFPDGNDSVAGVRAMLLNLRESDDTVKSLYAKFVDYLRTIPHQEHQIRVMTLMASKGLEADHVYIIGCNAGNIPGDNRSEHLSELEHREEQLRFLYVGFTRAKRSLRVSWSQYLPFAQTKAHHTPAVGTITKGGKKVGRVGICDFLQNLRGVQWQ